MKTRHARIVVKSDTENMIVQSKETSLRISFVVFVETLAIWLEIVQIGKRVLNGAMVALELLPVLQLVILALETPLTESTM
jgi:hypothetical protein